MTDYLTKYKRPLLIGLLAFLVRAVYLFALSGQPGFDVPMIDELWHWQWAQNIVEQSFWGDEVYFRAPLYPYLLAFFYWISSGSILISKLLQCLFCIGTAFYIYLLAEHLFKRTVATIASLFYAFYGTLVFYESMFLIPVLFLFLTVWGIYRLVVNRNSTSLCYWLLTGLIFGLAAISRPNILLTLPPLAIWLWWEGRAAHTSSFKSGAMILIGAVIAVVPVTVRNYVVTGEATLISSQGGINLYLGNNDSATGLSMRMPEVTLDESISWNHFLDATSAVAIKDMGRPLTAGEVSAYWTGKATDWIFDNPGQFIGLVYQKTVYLFNGFENSDNIEIYHHRSKSLVHSLLVWNFGVKFPFGILFPLALVGMLMARDRWRDLLPIYIFVLAYIPSIVLFLVTARHRLVLIPFLIILAAFGLYRLFKTFRLSDKNWLLACFVLVASTVLVNLSYFRIGGTNEFQSYYNEGLSFLRTNDYVNAELQFKIADAENPYSAVLLNNLGYCQYMQGKYREADQSYNRALTVDQRSFKVYNNLGLMARKQGQLDSAVVLFGKAIRLFDSTKADKSELAQYFINAGDIYARMGKTDSAGLAFELAIGKAPDYQRAFFKAATFYARTKQFGRSDTLFARGMALGEPDSFELFNWGLSNLERENYQRGIELMHHSLGLDSTRFQAAYCIASAHLQSNSPADSVRKYLDYTFRYSPGFQPALRVKNDLEQKLTQ